MITNAARTTHKSTTVKIGRFVLTTKEAAPDAKKQRSVKIKGKWKHNLSNDKLGELILKKFPLK